MTNTRVTPKGDVEGHFRRDVRYALDMDSFARDETIISEIQRLKQIEKLLEESRRNHVGACGGLIGGLCTCGADAWNARVDALM